jgi:hypothetical protein
VRVVGFPCELGHGITKFNPLRDMLPEEETLDILTKVAKHISSDVVSCLLRFI